MKLNKQFLAMLLLLSLLLALAGPALAAWEGPGVPTIAVQGYYRNLVFNDGVVPAANADELWGLIDENGTVVLAFQYQDLYGITHGYFCATKDDDNRVIIDRNGRELMDCGYWLNWWDDGFGFYEDGSNGMVFYDWDLQPSSAAAVIYHIPELSGLTIDPYGDADGRYFVFRETTIVDGREQSLCGIVDAEGNVIVPAQFAYIYILADENCVAFQTNDRRIFDEAGNELVGPGEYDSLYGHYDSDFDPASSFDVTKDGQKGLLGFDGKLLVPLGDYDEIGSVNPAGYVSASRYEVGDDNELINMESFLFKNGALVKTWTDRVVSTVRNVDNLTFRTLNGANNLGLMDYAGQVLLAPQFTTIDCDALGNLIARGGHYGFDGTCGVFTQEGETILPADYDDIELVEDRYLANRRDVGGLYSADGTPIIPEEYGDLSCMTRFILGSGEDGMRLWNLDGEELVGPWEGIIRQNYIPLDWIEYETKWNGARFLPFLLQVRNGDEWETVKTVELDLQTGKLCYEFPCVAGSVNQNGYYVYQLSDGTSAIGHVDLPQEQEDYDLNGDGELTAADAAVLFAYVSGEPLPAQAPDVNEDGKMGNLDAILLFRKAAGVKAEVR